MAEYSDTDDTVSGDRYASRQTISKWQEFRTFNEPLFPILYNINYSTSNEYKLCFNKAILTSSLEYRAQFEINDPPWLPVALWLIVRLLTVQILFVKRLAVYEHRLITLRAPARPSVVISDFSGYSSSDQTIPGYIKQT